MKLEETQLRELLAKLRLGLQAHFGPRLRDVRLYGSYARGNAYAGSDVDVAVVISGDVNEYLESEATGDLVAGLSLEYDTVVCCLFLSEQEFEKSDLAFLRAMREESLPV